MIDWWDYDQNYSENIPTVNVLNDSIKSLLIFENYYSKVVNALKIAFYEVNISTVSNEEKSNIFITQAKIIGFPENNINQYNPFSDEYDDSYKLFIDFTDYELIKAFANLENASKDLETVNTIDSLLNGKPNPPKK